MKKVIKNNYKFILGIIVGLIISVTSVYAVEAYIESKKVSYDNKHTEKDNVKLHGIGLKSIDSAVKNLNGIVDIEFKDNVFIMKILI